VHTYCREEEQLRVKGKKKQGARRKKGKKSEEKSPMVDRSHGKNIGDDKNLGVCQ
jgi:hypothetical protein